MRMVLGGSAIRLLMLRERQPARLRLSERGYYSISLFPRGVVPRFARNLPSPAETADPPARGRVNQDSRQEPWAHTVTGHEPCNEKIRLAKLVPLSNPFSVAKFC